MVVVGNAWDAADSFASEISLGHLQRAEVICCTVLSCLIAPGHLRPRHKTGCGAQV